MLGDPLWCHCGLGQRMHSDRLKRREFITLLGGAAAAWPVAARAQQPKVVRLGYLDPAKPTDATAVNLRRQFLLGMRDLGYIEGRHFKMEDRYAEGLIGSRRWRASSRTCRSTFFWSSVMRRFGRLCRQATRFRSS